VDAIPVALAGSDVRQIGVPREGINLLEANPALFARVVEQAEVDRFCDL
jgi:hypothetical protein